MLLVIVLASGLAHTPYSFGDALKICDRHERWVESSEEGAKVMAQHTWDAGFGYCRDLHEWAAEAANQSAAKDRQVIDEMQRALGPYPFEPHAK